MATAESDIFTSPIPAVNGEKLAENIGRRVSMVCKVESVSGSSANVTAVDGRPITVNVLPDTSIAHFQGTFVNIIGMAEGATLIREERSFHLGDKLDVEKYNRAVKEALGTYRAVMGL